MTKQPKLSKAEAIKKIKKIKSNTYSSIDIEILNLLEELIPILFKNDTDTIVSTKTELCEKHNLFKDGE